MTLLVRTCSLRVRLDRFVPVQLALRFGTAVNGALRSNCPSSLACCYKFALEYSPPLVSRLTFPNTTCLPSNQEVTTVHRKNCGR